VPGDTNGTADAFLTDLRTGSTRRVSVTSAGEQQVVSTVPTTPDPEQVELARYVAVDADGTRVAFESSADLTPGDGNGRLDVHVHHVVTGATRRVSVPTVDDAGVGTQAGTGRQSVTGDSRRPALSADGLVVAFQSTAQLTGRDGLTDSDAFVHDARGPR
jgi:hypothetical protein